MTPREIRAVNDAFLLCRHCGILHPAADLNFADEDAAHDLAEFRSAHTGHHLEEARRVPDSALFDAPTWDPMATRWFRVTTGTDLLQVRSSRSSIAEPRRHEVIAAPPSATDRIEIDEALLRRALDSHFFPHAVRPAKVERFVDTVRELLIDLDPGEVDTAFDDPTLPNASIGPFPTALGAVLFNRCTPIFDAWELERVRSFIEAHRLENGALAVRVRRVLARSAA
jgi:hypothetical protein